MLRLGAFWAAIFPFGTLFYICIFNRQTSKFMKKKIISGEIISPLSKEVPTKREQEIAKKLTNLSQEGSKTIVNEKTRVNADYLSRYYGSMEHIISIDKKQISS